MLQSLLPEWGGWDGWYEKANDHLLKKKKIKTRKEKQLQSLTQPAAGKKRLFLFKEVLIQQRKVLKKKGGRQRLTYISFEKSF